MGFYAHLKGANLEPSHKFSSQFIRDKQEILQRWTRHFQALLNNSSTALDPSFVHSLPQLQICNALGEPPTRGEVVLALRWMANANAMGLDNLPAELLNLGIRASFRLLAAFHGIILRIWQEQTVPQLWKAAVITGESPWLRMRARSSSRSWPFALPHTLNASVCCRSHNADPDQSGLQWT